LFFPASKRLDSELRPQRLRSLGPFFLFGFFACGSFRNQGLEAVSENLRRSRAWSLAEAKKKVCLQSGEKWTCFEWNTSTSDRLRVKRNNFCDSVERSTSDRLRFDSLERPTGDRLRVKTQDLL
jgi:hypothetical protein